MKTWSPTTTSPDQADHEVVHISDLITPKRLLIDHRGLRTYLLPGGPPS